MQESYIEERMAEFIEGSFVLEAPNDPFVRQLEEILNDSKSTLLIAALNEIKYRIRLLPRQNGMKEKRLIRRLMERIDESKTQ